MFFLVIYSEHLYVILTESAFILMKRYTCTGIFMYALSNTITSRGRKKRQILTRARDKFSERKGAKQ